MGKETTICVLIRPVLIESFSVMTETINVEKSIKVTAIIAIITFFKESPCIFYTILSYFILSISISISKLNIINFYYKDDRGDISKSSMQENIFFSYISTATLPIIAALSEQYLSSLKISLALCGFNNSAICPRR